jgi:hypothetical protein
VRPLLVALALTLLTTTTCRAAEDDVIDPDRPDLATSAKTVGRGRVQLEAGARLERTRMGGMPTERRLAAEATLRVGVGDRLELRVDAEPVVRLRGADAATDVGDFTLGAKWRFAEPPEGGAWPALALRPFLTLPTAPEPIGSGEPDFGAVLLASFELPAAFALDVNVGLAAVGQTRPSGYLVQAFTAASLSREVGRALVAFGEIFYASREERGGRDQVGVDAGLIWRVTADLALDLAAGTSLYGRVPDVLVRAGGSVRFGR